MPAECDVPLRKGWFFHPAENETVKSPEKLFDLYLKSVGRGACLDLGISPDTRGLLHENDVKALADFGILLNKIFATDLAKTAVITASNIRGSDHKDFGVKQLADDNRYSYWATDDVVKTPELILEWKTEQTFNLVRLRENIKLGQRIEAVELDAWFDGNWVKVGGATSIGACRIIQLEKKVTTTRFRLRVTQSPVCVALSEIGIFNR
jgi:alpha-L-fucosidase